MEPLRRLRLMQVVHGLGTGGSERVAYELSRGLDPSRVCSSLCALDLDGPLADDLRRAAIPFHVMGRRPGRDWPLIPRLYRLFRQQRVDVVQTHHLTQLLYSAVGARLAGARLVHVEHEYFSLGRQRIRRLLRVLAPLCHRIVAVGDEIKRFLVDEVGLRPANVTVIANGVNVARYAPRADAGQSGGRRLIGHVARLEPEKDQGTLLRAFASVLQRWPEARLELLGDGTLRGDLQRVAGSLGIAGQVDFLGWRDDVAERLADLDVFVLSSVNEGLPLALLEAMASARPVVATAVGEVPRVIRDGVTGVTVPPGDARAMAAAITAMLDRPAWAAEMGRAARKLIEDKYSLTRSVEGYAALYESLFGTGSGLHNGEGRRR